MGTLLAVLVLPSGIWPDWVVNVLPTGGYMRIAAGLFSPAAIWNQSLNGFFARALTTSRGSSPVVENASLARMLTYASAGLVAAISGLAVIRGSRIHPDGRLDRTMLVALPAMYLVAPFSWEQQLVYVLLSILILLSTRSRLPATASLVFYAACIGAAVLLGLSPWWLLFKFYGVIVLWMLCVFTACSQRIQLPNSAEFRKGF